MYRYMRRPSARHRRRANEAIGVTDASIVWLASRPTTKSRERTHGYDDCIDDAADHGLHSKSRERTHHDDRASGYADPRQTDVKSRERTHGHDRRLDSQDAVRSDAKSRERT